MVDAADLSGRRSATRDSERQSAGLAQNNESPFHTSLTSVLYNPGVTVRRAARYRRRRLTALGVLCVVVAGLVVLVSSPGHRSSPRRAQSPARVRSPHRSAAAHPRAAAPALSLAGIPTGQWTSLAQSPTPRGEVSAARIGNVVYVVGGFDSTGHTTGLVQRLDLASGRWRTVRPLPQPLNHMSAVVFRGDLYVVGGYSELSDTSTGAVSRFWRYDPATGGWHAMPDAPVARAAAGAAVLGHRLYVAGGRNDTTAALSSLAIYDFDTGRWSLGPSLAHAREHVAAVTAGGAVWLLGGRVSGVGVTYVERYRPGATAWQEMSPLPVARSGFQAVSVGHSILAVGGENGASTVPEVDRLDLRTDRWSRLGDLPVPRHGLGLVADGPLVFAIDGGPQPGLTMSRVVERLRVG
jgi:Kelch motif